MSEERRATRRQAIATIASGAVLGGIWGAAFPALAMESRPTLSVVGRRNAQVVLIDSTDARALVLVGAPDDDLMSRLPAMMTMFRQRIDLIVGAQSILATRADRLRDRWTIIHAISLQSNETGEFLSMPATRVTGDIGISLGGGLSLICRVGHRDEWRSNGVKRESPLWTATLTHTGGTTVIAPDTASIAATSPPAASLIVTPDIPSPEVARRYPSRGFAANYDSASVEGDISTPGSLTRIYPEDIARFVLHDDGIDLPSWTVTYRDGD